MRRSAVARAANLIIDHSGSGKPLGWLPAPYRKLCHFGANLGPHGAAPSGPPQIKRFHAAKTQTGHGRTGDASGGRKAYGRFSYQLQKVADNNRAVTATGREAEPRCGDHRSSDVAVDDTLHERSLHRGG